MREADYGGPQSGSAQTYAYTAQETDSDVRAWITLLDNSVTIESIEHYLNGEELRLNINTKKWEYKIVRTPLINKEGINKILYIITPYLSPIISLSNFRLEEINARCLEISLNLTWNLAINQEKYKVDPNDLSLIKNMVVNTIEANYRKAKDGNLVNIFSKTQHTREVISQGDKGSVWGKVLNKFS